MEKRVNELLPLAAKIAREFSNIPGLPNPEIELAAQEALANAARLFDPAKGDFTAIATLREKLESMGFQGLDTVGLLKSGCGVPPQAVLEASRRQSFAPS